MGTAPPVGLASWVGEQGCRRCAGETQPFQVPSALRKRTDSSGGVAARDRLCFGVFLPPLNLVRIPFVQDGKRISVCLLITHLIILTTQVQPAPTAESHPQLL